MIDAIKFRELVEAYERYYATMIGEREGSELAQEASWCVHDARIELHRFLLSHADALLALVEEPFRIGKFGLRKGYATDRNCIWIGHVSGERTDEGGDFPTEDIEALIEGYYNEHF